jgi:hypothetical protein
MRDQYKGPTLKGDISVVINQFSYYDSDALEKAIFDSLEEADVIGNDRDILYHSLTKIRRKRGQPTDLAITVYEINQNAEDIHSNNSGAVVYNRPSLPTYKP